MSGKTTTQRRIARVGQCFRGLGLDRLEAGKIPRARRTRRGLASLDYALILGVVFPLTVFIMWAGPRIMWLVYEMVAVLIAWPFM